MEKYSEYKYSKDLFLNLTIPSHWQEMRIRHTGTSRNGLTYSPMDVCDSSEGTLVLRSSNIQDGKLVFDDNVYVKGDIKEDLFVQQGDILICSRNGSRDLVGKLVLIPENIKASFGAFMMIYRTTMWDRFMVYALDVSIKRYKSLFSTSTINQLVRNDFNNFIIQVPPLHEQQAIVSYLDDKCGKIDQLLENKAKELELLAEMKQRVIADAVTKGLNPDVTMKDSGIPWLPQIPEHWEVKPVRSLLKEADEKSDTGTEELLSLSQYIGITYKKDAGKTGMFEAESTIGYKIVHAGQFVMNIMLAWNGSYAVSGLDGIISPAYCVFNFICECDKQYYDYLLRIKAYCGAFKTASRGIIDSRLRLYPNKFMPFPILCPPLDEQKAIVAHIEEKVSKIDALADKLQKEIESIKEYKQRLISDVVTGQIKVC